MLDHGRALRCPAVRRLFLSLLVGVLLVLTSCADGFAPRGDGDDEKFDEGAAPAIGQTRTPEPRSTPAATPAGQGEFALLACSGADVDDLYEREVTGGFSDVTPPSGTRSQLDWTIVSNPRFVTLTIGANDTGFVGPDQLFLDDGKTLDRPQVDRRMTVIRRDLRFVIEEIVAKTDATVFVTNYYNPTAESPQGIPTCRRECFSVLADQVVREMNDIIEEVARSFPPDRVVFVDFETPFIGKGAPNGLGPDGFREGGFGIIGDLFAGQLKDVHPYCARGDTIGESWISSIDCVHPDERGTTELAAILAGAMRTHLASGLHSGA